MGAVVAALSLVTSEAAEYYVSPAGNDANPGTAAAPFRTIARGAAVARAGDVCFIRAGTYEEILAPANSGTAGNPIVFQAYPGERVILTAMQALSGWTHDAASVYKTTVTWDLGQKNFVLHGLVPCDLARWPNNTDGDPWTQNSLRNTGGSAATVITDAFLDYAPGIPPFDWSKGGSVYFYGDKPGAGWTTWRSFIKSSTTTRVTFDLNKNPTWIRTEHAPADRGDFFLEGIREALDFAHEWYFDPATRTLFLQIPGGGAPVDGHVSMRRRIETIDLRNRSYIEVRNLTVFGGEILISGTSNRLFGVSSFHGNRTRGVVTGFHGDSRSVDIRGSNHTIERCEIAFGSGTGIWDSGTNSRIINNYIHDFNYLGDYDAIIMSRDGGGGVKLLRNTIARGGRDAIQMVANNGEVAYNDVSRSNLIADDCGLFYTIGGPRNIAIHHNWFHDAYSSGAKFKAAGIYLDNSSEGFDVHHNVVWNTGWTSVQMNWNARDINIYNNTFWSGSAVMGAWRPAGTAFSNVKVYNNLSNDGSWDPQTDRQNNRHFTPGDPFVDLANRDFRLRAGTSPIDAGRAIAGFTDGYVGTMPDQGAYEFGAPSWIAGIDWDASLGPVAYGEARLTNLSVRTLLTADQVLIVGFVMEGAPREVLLRAVGPGLASFLAGVHPDPSLELYRGSALLAANDNWPAGLAPDMARAGAFAFSPGSRDAAMVQRLDGAHTAWVRGPGQGVVLFEAYDTGAGGGSRLVNVSVRNVVGTGSGALIAGIVIDGDAPRSVLVRGIGPALGRAPFNLAGFLVDPRIDVFDAGGRKVAENDNWPAILFPVFAEAGAFQLESGSRDAALRVALPPGAYTVQVSGGTGEALAEVYAIP